VKYTKKCKDAINVGGAIVCRRELIPCRKVEEKDCPASDKYENIVEKLKKIFLDETEGENK